MRARQLDDHRRLVMPRGFSANSSVLIDQVDNETVLIRKLTRDHGVKLIAFQSVKRLPVDPEREAIELRLAKTTLRNVPEPE